MRPALVALAALALLAGCATPSSPATSPATSTAGSALPSTTNNGFCGPPICSPCPPQQDLNVDPATDADAQTPVLVWSKAPAANRTAEIQGYIDQAESQGHVLAQLPEANLTRIFSNLHDAWAAQNPGMHPPGARDPIVVVDGQARLRFFWSQVVC